MSRRILWRNNHVAHTRPWSSLPIACYWVLWCTNCAATIIVKLYSMRLSFAIAMLFMSLSDLLAKLCIVNQKFHYAFIEWNVNYLYLKFCFFPLHQIKIADKVNYVFFCIIWDHQFKCILLKPELLSKLIVFLSNKIVLTFPNVAFFLLLRWVWLKSLSQRWRCGVELVSITLCPLRWRVGEYYYSLLFKVKVTSWWVLLLSAL